MLLSNPCTVEFLVEDTFMVFDVLFIAYFIVRIGMNDTERNDEIKLGRGALFV